MAKGFTYKMEIDADVSALTGKLKTLKDALASVTSDGKEPKIAKILDQLSTRIDNIKTKAATPVKSEAAFASMEKEIQGVQRLLERLGVEIGNVGKKANAEKISLLPEAEQKKLLAIVDAMKKYDSAIDTSIKKSKELLDAEKKLTTEEGRLEDAQKKLKATKKSAEATNKQRDAAKEALDEAKARQDAAKAAQEQYEKILKMAEARKKEAAVKGEKIDLRSEKFDDGQGGEITLAGARGKIKSTTNAAAADDMNALSDAYKTAKANADALNTSIGTQTATVEKYQNSVNLAKDKVGNLTKAFDANKLKASNDAFNDLRQAAKDLGASLEGIGADNTPENVDLLKQRMEEFVAQGIQPVNEQLQQATNITEQYRATTEHASETNRQNTETFKEQNEAAGEVTGLMNRIKQFTGLAGAAILMRKALHNAFQTTKELDKQFTEMAVVTDLQVGDYWEQLPQFTAEANALGVAIKDVAAAQTLYYQQGLKAEQVAQLENSTLKMARIAGLDAADATDKMTAALRGFNMEINQTNADRIADVYSVLAARTASDVKEISTAMTKTASLASNAGMEFETTAAFLSQIIETTRESAETAGTALKTVIARFQELKKSPEEMDLSGDNEGANKIETALRSVGVALRDAQGQFRDLDDVFLELSGKWDTLDTNTQRYIATIAAGSRQQSRFIAMMSDYSRTQELVSTANNAAGASNEQFQKTLESLETKLNRLKNAWDTFTQGLANNEFIKVAIDILTGMLTAINKITEGFGPWSGSAMKIGLVTAALIAGDKALKAFMASLHKNNGVLKSFDAALKAPLVSFKQFIARLAASPKNMKKFVGTVKSAKPQLDNLSKSSGLLASAQERAQEAMKSNDLKGQSAALKEVAAAQQNYKKAIDSAAAALGVSSDQIKNYEDFTNMNIDSEKAAILTKQGYTKETLKSAAATELGTDTVDDETAAKYGNVVATNVQEAAEGAESKTKLGGWLASKLKTAQERLETKGKFAQIVATKLHTVALWLEKAAMWEIMLVILAIIAVIAILVVSIMYIIALFKDLKANSPEGQFKAASEALEKASAVADQAAAAYNDLKDSLADLNDKYDALDEMTVGTQEWRDALLEVNAEVMDLIDKYPELVDAMEVDANGVMRISEEAQKQVIEQKAAVNARAQSAKLAAQIAKNDAKANLDYSKLSDEAIAGNEVGAGWKGARQGMYYGSNGVGLFNPAGMIAGGIIGGIQGAAKSRANNRKVTDELAKAIGANEFNYLDSDGGIDQDELKRYMTEVMKMAPDEAQQWIEDLDEETLKELKEYGQTLNANAKAQEAAMQSMISNAMAMVDVNNYTSEQLQQMSNIGTDLMEDTLDAQKATIKGLSSDEYKKRVQDYYGELGEDVEVDKDGSVKYKDTEGNEVKLTKDQAEAQLAAADAADEMKKKLELLPKALEKAQSQKGGEALGKAYNDKEGKSVSRDDLADLQGDALKELYENNEELQQIYGDFAKFEEEMNKRTELANQAFAQNAKDLEKIGMKGFSFDKKLTAAAEEGLIEHMSQIVAVSGPEVGEQLGAQINGILDQVAVEDRDKLAAQLNAIDWHDADALEALPETLKKLGYNIPTNQLDDFISSAKEAAHAVHNINMDKLKEDLLDLTNIINNIRTNQQGRTFESDAYEKLIAADASLRTQFVQNLDGTFTYLGTSLDKLTEAVLENTDAKVQEKQTILQNQLNTRKIMDDIAKTSPTQDVDRMLQRSEKDQRDYITQVIKYANDRRTSLGGISAYLSTDTDVSTLDKAQIKEIINALKGVGTIEAIQTEMAATVLDAKVTENLKQDAYYNTRTNTQRKATRSAHMTDSDITSYQSERRALISQAQSAGLSERDLKLLMQYNAELEKMEAEGNANTREYRNLARATNAVMKQVAKTTSFETMYKAMEENVAASNDLVEAYNNTTDAMRKQQLVAQMMSEFDIKVTANNYEQLAVLTEAYLQGNEEAFVRIVQLSGQAAGVMGDTYNDLNSQTVTHIEKMGQEYIDFMNQMINAGYGYIDSVTNKFHYGTAQLLNIAKDTVDQLKAWENPYDWLYNANSLVNAQIRERNQLEREYQRMVEDGAGVAADLAKNLAAQAESLQKESDAQKSIYDNAKAELKGMINSSEYGTLLKEAVAVGPNGQITVDKEKLYASGYNEDAGGIVEEMIGKVESLVDTMASAEDALEDNYDALRELKNTGKDEYTGLLDRVTNTLRNQYQKEIDSLSAINDSVTEAADVLVSKIQEKIDDDRKAREDEKALQNLEDKQTRLAYLQASGGSALDILKLRQEIDNDTEVYQDQLVDDAVSEMEKANQQAADQRQQQIDIAQAQYDWWSENESIHDAEEVLNASLQQIAAGTNPLDSTMGKLLEGGESVQAQSKVAIQDWYKELGNTGNLAAIYAKNNDLIGETGKTISAVNTLKHTLNQTEGKIQSDLNSVKSDMGKLGLGNASLLTNVTMTNLTKTELGAKLEHFAKAIDDLKGKIHTGGNDVNTNDEVDVDVNPPSTTPTTSTIPTTTGTKMTMSTDAQLLQEWILAQNLQEGDRGRWGQAMANRTLEDGRNVLAVWNSLSKTDQTGIAGANTVLEKAKTSIRQIGTDSQGYAQWYYDLAGIKYGPFVRQEGAYKDLMNRWEKMSRFAAGGLADFTGPAWLDGTPSAPELVLNATDTANFIALKDILSEIMRGASARSSDKTLGNNYYDIEVHVDSIDSDYDVDQAVERMKELIEADAMYRNVNAVQKTR